MEVAKFSTDLKTAVKSEINLVPEYWSPQQEGESKRLYFMQISNLENINEETGEQKILRTISFYDPTKKCIVTQSSARLIGVFEHNMPVAGEAFEIVYEGKKKNTTNPFLSDRWSVFKLKTSNV